MIYIRFGKCSQTVIRKQADFIVQASYQYKKVFFLPAINFCSSENNLLVWFVTG